MNTLCPSKPWVTKLSSAGLVFLHFGHRVVSQVLKTKENDAVTNEIYDKIYEKFIQEIDAIDNGISQSDDEPRYIKTLETVFNPLILKRDQHLISPHNITPKSKFKDTRIKEMITNKRSSWLLNKFSLSAPKEIKENSKENMHTDVWVKRVTINMKYLL